MNEGILNKLARLFYTKTDERRSNLSLDQLAYMMMQQVSEGQVAWDDRQGLLRLYFGTTANCVDIISTAVSSVGVELYKESGKNGVKGKLVSKDYREWLDQYQFIRRRAKSLDVETVDRHPVLDLLAFVNGKLTEQNLYDISTQHLELAGNTFWYIDYSPAGIPALMRFISPDKIIDIEEDEKGAPVKYWYNNSQGIKQSYDAKNIIHFWYPGPFSLKFGVGKAYKISGWANTEKNLITYLNSNFRNMGIPPAVLSFKTRIPDDQFQRFKKQFEDMYRGVGESGKLAFTSGEYEITKIGFTPDEMGIEVTTRLAREMIANGFGVPISKLTDATNRAVAERQDVQYLRDEIQPKIMLIANELTESLLPKYGNTEGMFFAAPDIVPDDINAKLEERKTNLESGVTTRNEERVKMKIEPYPDDNADKLYIPGSLVQLGIQPIRQGEVPRQIVDEIMKRIKEKESNANH